MSAWIKSDTLVAFDVTAMAEQAHSLEPTDCARLTPPWQPQEASFNELSHFPKEAVSIPCSGRKRKQFILGEALRRYACAAHGADCQTSRWELNGIVV